MKAATLGNATRTVGKMFFGLVLLALAVAAGFGGTAVLVYHQLGSSRPVDARVADRARMERKESSRPSLPAVGKTEDQAQPRRVAATAAALPVYTYADNNGGQPSAPAKRQKPAANVPAALEAPARPDAEPSTGSNLNDPESHYIVDSRTGRVIGIDGTEGARREAAEEQRRLEAAPRAVAVQTPVPEVRVASPVTEYGQPVYHGAQPASDEASGSQGVPVRRAMPVSTYDAAAEPRSFNVAEYLANDRNRPAFRAQPVNSVGTRTARTTHVFRLPDGTQAYVAD